MDSISTYIASFCAAIKSSMRFYEVSVSSYLATVKLLSKFLCNKKPYDLQTNIKIFVIPPVTGADLRRPYPGGQNARCDLPSACGCQRAGRVAGLLASHSEQLSTRGFAIANS